MLSYWSTKAISCAEEWEYLCSSCHWCNPSLSSAINSSQIHDQPSYGLSFPGNFNAGTCPKVEVGSATTHTPSVNYKQTVSAARKEVFGIVDKIGGLTLQQKLVVSKTLVNNTDELELFSSLPGVARAEYVRMMLAGEL